MRTTRVERAWHYPSPAVHLHLHVVYLPDVHEGQVQLLLKRYDYELIARLITAQLITVRATLARERWQMLPQPAQLHL